MQIILGSSSIYRAGLLKKYIPNFETQSPNIDESPREKESAKDLSLRLALSKARKISLSEPDALVIGSDQVASFNGNILGKPKSYDDAYKTIMAFSNGEVLFYTGVAIIHKNKDLEESYIDVTRVIFKDFDDEMLREYLDSEESLNTTAGVKMESNLFQKLVAQIETEDPEAIIGLPIQWLLKKLTP
tara:strand:+ start:517 stop:1077 length:561 start_codon:yes stop_codon:yes gene_type:complete